MLRTTDFTWRTAAILLITVVSSTSTGCRQLGNRSQRGPTPIGPSAPAFTPYETPGAALQDIPPMPPSAASTYDPSAPKGLQPGGWSLPKALQTQPASPSIRPVSDSKISTGFSSPRHIKLTAGDETESPLVLPPGPLNSDDEELVPPPSDAEDEPQPVALPTNSSPVVELDVTEFLAELEQTPAPIQAQSHLEPLPVTVTGSPVITAPTSVASSSMTPWPHGADYGIAINPGPTGAGNRLEALPVPANPWNTGRIGSLPQSPVNYWAGQNSDWGGRQFR